jgi:hypothetical protein
VHLGALDIQLHLTTVVTQALRPALAGITGRQVTIHKSIVMTFKGSIHLLINVMI